MAFRRTTGVVVILIALPWPVWAQEEWSLGAPLYSIGEGGAQSEYSRVEAMTAIGSRLYIANRGTSEIRMLDLMTGDYLAATGGQGQGPGEFEWLAWLDTCDGARLHAFDPVARRVSVFDDDLSLVTTFLVDPTPAGRIPQSLTCMGEELLVLYRSSGVEVGRGPYRPQMELATVSAEDGAGWRTLGEIPGDERDRREGSDGPRTLGKTTVVVGQADGFVVGTGDGWRLERRDRQGTVLGRLQANEGLVPISDAEIETLQQQQLAAGERYGSGVVAGIRRSQREAEYPANFPPYSTALQSPEGQVWVRRYPSPMVEPGHWKVFGELGEVVAVVETPPDLKVLWLGEEFVAGVRRDRLDVEYVEVVPIVR